MAITLKDEIIVDRWGMIVTGANGRTEEVYAGTEKAIEKSKAPNVVFERVEINPGFLKGMFGKARTCIQVVNKSLSPFRMYMGVRDYGANLDCYWYMTFEPPAFMKAAAKAMSVFKKTEVVPNLDFFDRQDLQAYATVVHNCFTAQVEKLTKESGQVIDRKTTGFLGIS